MMFNVIYLPGTKGALLCYFLCKFSRHGLETDDNPFDTDGTVHRYVQSNRLPAFHADFITHMIKKTDMPCVVLSLNTWTDYLYYLLSLKIRAGNINADPDLLWKRSKEECEKTKGLQNDIQHLQKMHYTAHNKDRFTKKEIRDWYRQPFYNKLESFFMYKEHKNFESNQWFNKQNVYRFNFDGFYSWTSFKQELIGIDKTLSIGVDFTREDEMIDLFEKSIEKDTIISQVIKIKKIIERLQQGQHSPVPQLNVVCEAFLLIEIERLRNSKIDIGDVFPVSTQELV